MQDTLPLDIAPPRNPAVVLYQLWAAALDFYEVYAYLGDRVRVMWKDATDGEDAIQLYNERTYSHMLTLWPDGSFKLDKHIVSHWDFWEQHTFLSNNWAGRQRVIMVRNEKPMSQRRRWPRWRFETVNEKNFEVRRPYLEPHAFSYEVRYHLIHDGRFWQVEVDPRFPDDDATQALAASYARAQARYDRHERATHQHRKPRNLLALKTTTGRLTGIAAIEEMVKHLPVYVPKATPRPLEADH